jgi:exodeoxyribonuclease-3
LAPGSPLAGRHSFPDGAAGMTVKIATWNVNSIRRRLDGLRALAEEAAPDIVCLQETKVVDELFPAEDIAAMGYPHQAISGQKAYNGVAILSKFPLADIERPEWCGRADARHIYASADLGSKVPLEVHSLYIPAGGDKPDPLKNPKFAHKLEFITEQTHWWSARGPVDRPGGAAPRLLAGDFNVAPLASDVWSHERLKNIVTHTEIEIRHLMALQRAGEWHDAIRHFLKEDEHLYTWWSYRAVDWEAADKGRRLDHIWVTPDLAPALTSMTALRDARNWDPPSDHVPVILEIDPGKI